MTEVVDQLVSNSVGQWGGIGCIKLQTLIFFLKIH